MISLPTKTSDCSRAASSKLREKLIQGSLTPELTRSAPASRFNTGLRPNISRGACSYYRIFLLFPWCIIYDIFLNLKVCKTTTMVLLFIFFGLRHFRAYVNDYFSKSARCYFGNFIYNDLVALDLQFRFHCFSGFAWSFSCDVPCGQCSLWSDFDLRFFLLKCTPLRRIRHIRPYRSRLFRMRRRQFSGTQCHYALCFAWQVAPNSSENIFLRDENAARGRSLSDTPRVITRVVRHEIFLHCFCDLIAVVFVGVVFPCSAVRFRFFTLRVNFHSRTKPHTALSCFVQVRSQVTSQDPNNQNSRRCKLD